MFTLRHREGFGVGWFFFGGLYYFLESGRSSRIPPAKQPVPLDLRRPPPAGPRVPFPRPAYSHPGRRAAPGCHVCGAARPGTGGRSPGNRQPCEGRRRGERPARPPQPTGAGSEYRGARRGGAAASLGRPGPPPGTFRPTEKSVRGGGRRSRFFF